MSNVRFYIFWRANAFVSKELTIPFAHQMQFVKSTGNFSLSSVEKRVKTFAKAAILKCCKVANLKSDASYL